ncbi:MAG: disulfide bond formation protein B [Holosporaceae bacterium]
MYHFFSAYKINPRHIGLFVGLFGISGFLAAVLWQMLGATPCFLCLVERYLFLAGGLVALATFRCSALCAQRLLACSGTLWACLSFTTFYHMGIQFRWLRAPSVCQASSLPLEDSVEALEAFLSSKTQVSCTAIEFTFLGLPPTFYLLGVASCFTLFCFWGFTQKTQHSSS